MAAAPDPEDADFRRLMDLAHGFMGSQVLFTACDLGVFEALAAGPLDAASVARVLGLSPRGARLLLDACAGLRLLQRREEAPAEEDCAYALAPPSRELLLAGGARSPARDAALPGGRRPTGPGRGWAGPCVGGAWRAVGGAPSPTTSSSPPPTRFSPPDDVAAPGPSLTAGGGRSLRPPGDGQDEDDDVTYEPFAAIYRSEAERLSFMRALQDTWRVAGGRVLAAFDLSPFRVICDVGGGSGALAAACARLYPGSAVCVFETPGVVAAARAHFPPGPARLCAGDFFRSRLPAADLYILARVLHDWPDEACARLLGRIRAAGGPGAAVLVVEALLAPGGRGPLPALLLSLNVLVQTGGGRERTRAPVPRELCARAGFPRFRCRRTGGAYDVMLARK
ncbi:LOW QUALITY PROTEIN: acetylserotonin O-methyltransferase [Peromyscus californicus insignis]|uniref:LOW QUALITY PROTEIN: acetylserotonin O-methyltransferase n=1 Tax=Peromyscus californicus insignis TaxID=564181 RepID=UPI0022A76FF2|nr:LOW QUALITY PROTEIN: acetylserotonin O-methyltransferase [Peromyscus californicus insignis]